MALVVRIFEGGTQIRASRRESDHAVPAVGDRVAIGNDATREVLSRRFRYGSSDVIVELEVGPPADDVVYTDPKITFF